MNLTRISIGAVLLAVAFGCFTGCSKEAKAERHRTRADRYFHQQDYAKAEVEYMNVLRLSPKDPSAVRQLAFLFFEQGRLRRAFPFLTEAKNREPQNGDVRLRLATLFLQAGSVSNALAEARFVLTNQPTNTPALFILVDSIRSPTNAAGIRQEVEAFGAKHGLNADVHVALAELDFRERNVPKAEEHLNKAAALSPKSSIVNMGLAKLWLAKTNLAEGERFLKLAADSAPIRSIHRVQLALFKLRTGDTPAARQILREITEKAADYIPAWNALADIALGEKDFEECAKITTTVLKLDPDSFEARLLRGRMFVLQNEPAEAVAEFTRLDALFPVSAVKYHLAIAHHRSGDTPKAVTALNQALQMSPGYPDAVLMLAEINIRSGKAATAIAPLSQLVRSHPEHLQAALLLATAHQMAGQFDAALKIYRDLSARFPKNPQFSLLAGLVFRQQKKLPEARAEFTKSQEIAPAFAPAVEQLVQLDVAFTNFPAALERCQRLATVLTNSAVPMVLEAQVHGARKDMKAAEEALLRGLQREPDSQAAITLLAGLYSDQKNYDNALIRLDDLLKRNPKSAPAWMQKGVIYQAKGENAKAKDAYQRAVEADPKHGPALNNLGFMLSEEPGKLEEAFSLATRARQAAPTNAAIADTLGWINYKKRAFLPARGLFAEALETMDVAEIRYHLGITDYALNNETTARENLEVALKGNLEKKLRDDATARLTILNFNPDTAQPAQISQLEAAAKRDPSDYLALMRLGEVYRKQNALENAQTAFEAASRANPQTSAPLLQLVTLLTGRDNARAYEVAKKARKLDPNNPSVALAYGSAALRQNDYQAALVALPEGLDAPERSEKAEYDLSVARYAMGQITPAVEGFRKLAAGNGSSSQTAKEALALVNGSGKVSSERISSVEARLKTNPNDFLALVARAEIDEQQGKFKEAAELYGKAVQLSPEFWPAHRRMAYLYSEHLKDDKLALQHGTRARQMAPGDAVVAHVLGKVAFRNQDYPNALRYFQEVARVTTTSGEPYYFIGISSLRLSHTNDSKVALTKALEMPLAPDLVQHARRVLNTLK